MTCIRSIGTYIPYYRIRRADVAEQHGESRIEGETAVPNHDEDVVTMAVSAAENALADCEVDAPDVDAVFAASVSSGFAECGIAAEVAHALGATGDVRVADFGSSVRSVTAALEAAHDGILADRVERALVVAADVLPAAEPGTASERTAGAGAGAMVLGREDGIGELVTIASETTGYVDPVRPAGEGFREGHARFNRTRFVETVGGLLDGYAGTLERISIPSPHENWGERAHRKSDCEAPLDSTYEDVGYAGAAGVLLDTALAFGNSTPGDRVGVVTYGGGGATMSIFETCSGVGAERTTLETYLESKEYVTYAEHRSFRRGEP